MKKKSEAAECIMSFIRRMENLNDVKVKELSSDNGIDFRNHTPEEFCYENRISQNFSSPSLGWLLEEIHLTWAHLEKKRTRLRPYTKSLEEYAYRYQNHVRTLGDYSRPSHEGYQNSIELPDGNNVVPLRSDTMRLVQNGCSFHGLRSEDANQHLKDFLKLVDSLDLDVANRERTRMRLFKFSLRDQASN
ncbi:zinc finger, CCHC-type containing protein [Tanacetum coccineum]|uniref:Zinc finger, CCHC-type containing protein n=1 Tax=Tanacetum coccineum TaxID=301880 RepID=A0ABQ5DV00_9ASTR